MRESTLRRCRVKRLNADTDAASCGKLSEDKNLSRSTGRHEIFQDSVRDFLVEAARIPKGREIKLQRLGFDAKLAGDVVDSDSGEVCLARHRTKRRKIRRLEPDPVIPLRVSVCESLQGRAVWLVGETG